ncbi:O-succinylbenzoate synthase [Aeropyrum pernix K1]|uniref:o-succinylbenzoate synthase n=1 Tax=Aeropyrum pernix (strain ATCC 700893 / DSM 11879 / JCM 9820 / NBRC 100138 / K1) TaxID=272557 RepID=Q9YE58_AERPE|nr:o-succinylbenzoate synthase [Aeropyrum pernix]BAA79688.2 O-succinylbenzoate synthase [Aeropyrum pernix K1]
MEVVRLEVFEVWMPLVSEFRTSFGSTRLRPALLVRAVEKGGEEGWGEVVAGEGPWYSSETVWTAWHVIEDYIARLLPSTIEHPREVGGRLSRIRGHNMAKAGVEMALWDLKARMESKPLWSLIGGVKRDVSVGVSVGIQPSIEDLVRTVSRYLEEGYGRIKIKIEPGWDLEPVEALRREFPDVPLQVDANAAYTFLDAPRLSRLDDYGLLMIEQPFHHDDLLEHAHFQSMVRTPVCLDESVKSVRDAVAALKLGSARVINIKPGRVGGIASSLEIHDFWSLKAHLPVWIGGMLETGVGRGHLVALGTLPGVRYPSDISASRRYYMEDIVDEPWELERGSVIRARSRPGIGVEVDWGRLNKYVKKSRRLSLQGKAS